MALAPGETKTVSFALPMRALAYCDVPGKQWKADKGTYDIEVGASSRDIKLTAPLQLTSNYTEAIPDMDDQLGDSSGDLALHAHATASSTQTGYPASNVTDGDDNTRWGSDFTDPQWLQVDLGAPKTFGHIQIFWEEHASARAYSLETSNDGASWNKVYETTNSTGGLENVRFDPVTRVTRACTEQSETRPTAIRFSVSGFCRSKTDLPLPAERISRSSTRAVG